ncbi:putative Mitochondrial phosphate carrier protein 1, mitochondrial [Cocos nucifera]|uniref:Putative Mitochondrial phosphate carrier protein 1, mitochondrial n=1 Tax=Cocos nucifera TaxID=13894 RepID=A0A8K0IT02_COCNU|nr:putative Mitochondrial phosphate carrier protein 1, mitochondrial [Cocos nucifera]
MSFAVSNGLVLIDLSGSYSFSAYIDPAKYRSTTSGFGVLLREQGLRGLFKGWVPTLLGYSAQGACKYGLYEYFKKYYSDIAGPENASKYKTLIYLAGSASAEVIADVALCPMEAVKVRVQTQPGFARGLGDGFPKFVKSEGYLGLYKGLLPLWGRQIPYTMMKFASYENTVELLYKYAIPTPKEECSKTLQLGVSFAGGYIAGVFCAVVSHPADNIVSFLNNAKGATVNDAVKKLGLWGLFTRGLPLRIVMIGTLTAAQWVIYDAVKVLAGLPTTGRVDPAAAPAPELAQLKPDTMMKFASYENTVELLYKYAIPTPKEECSKTLQLGVSFAGGYIAGVFCAVVSHPADNIVSFLNNAKGATVNDAVKKLGLWGLFTRGLPLRIVMIGTLTAAQWVIYDAVKVLAGLPTTGRVDPAAAPAPELAQLKPGA